MKRIFTCITVLVLGVAAAWAYDFSVVHEGQKLFFNILPEAETPEAELTCELGDGVHSYGYTVKLTGVINVPLTVAYNGVDYRITAVSNYAFAGCPGITSVVLHDEVKRMGKSVFAYCSALASVTLPGGLTELGDYMFDNCNKLPTVDLPQSLLGIGVGTFSRCTSLTQIDLPAGLTSIGDNAFSNCSGLQEINFPEGVKQIGSSAFSGCGKLQSVTIPAGVEILGSSAFYNCVSLAEINILNPGMKIGRAAFNGTAWHNGIAEGEMVYLGTMAMGYKFPTESTYPQSFVKTSIELREGTTAITDDAFSGRSISNPNYPSTAGVNPLESVRYITIPRSVTHIGANAFSGCTKLPVVTIPEQVQEVGADAFTGCSALKTVTWLAEDCRLSAKIFPPKLDKIEFGKTIRTVPAHICEENTALTSVAIPHSVKTIGEKAFFLCTDLYQVAIGAGVTTLGDRAFYGCADLTNITCYTMTPPAATPYCFLDVPITATVKVPCGTVPLYEAAPEWKYFWSFLEIIAYNATGYSSNEEWGTVSVEQTCAEACFRAEPVVGCKFLRWNDGDTQNPRIIPLSDHVELIAEFSSETSGIDSVWGDGTDVYAADNTIFIRNNDSQVTVYDTTGRMVYQGFQREISLDRGGVYIVEIEGKHMKVVISK